MEGRLGTQMTLILCWRQFHRWKKKNKKEFVWCRATTGRGGLLEEENCHPVVWFQFRPSLASILKAFSCPFTCCQRWYEISEDLATTTITTTTTTNIKSNQIKSNQIKSRASDSTTFSVPISIESNPFVWIIDVNSATIWLHFDDFQLGSVLSQFWAFLLPISAGFDTLLPMVSIRGGFFNTGFRVMGLGYYFLGFAGEQLWWSLIGGAFISERWNPLRVERRQWRKRRPRRQPAAILSCLIETGPLLGNSWLDDCLFGGRISPWVRHFVCILFVFFFSRLRSVTLNERRVKIPRRNFLFPFCGDSEVVAAISAQ